MKKFTFAQTNIELEEGYGSLFQREILAYLVSKHYKGLFLRSKLFFNKKNNSYHLVFYKSQINLESLI